MTIVRSSAYSSREWKFYLAHRCLVVRIVCITIPLLKFWCGMALLLGLTAIFIVILWIVDGPRFHVPVSGALLITIEFEVRVGVAI